MPVTRLAVLPDKRRIILGIDKANIFEAGNVYDVINICEQILIRKVGKYALPATGFPSEKSTCNDVVFHGLHLLTDEELHRFHRMSTEGK